MQHNDRIVRLIMWILVLTLLGSIFLLSNQPASQSGAFSMKIAEKSLHIYEKVTHSEISLVKWNHKVRKAAHFSLYFIVAVFLMLLCAFSKWRTRRSVFITLAVGVLYAIADELHQLFVDGRGASIRDVGIDSMGIVLGIIVVYLIKRR